MLKANTQSRKWLITLNNPQVLGISLDKFADTIKLLSPDYFCICKEIASTGTPHYHGFVYSSSPKRFGTLKKLFPTAHFDKAYGSCRENRTYLEKEGKWEDDHKHDTKVEGTFREEGDLPSERCEKNPELFKVVELIKGGASSTDIVEEFPQYAMHIKNIDELRNAFCGGVKSGKERNVFVTYIYSPDNYERIGIVYSKHDYKDVCRITNYGSSKGISFDSYNYQNVIAFENFTGQFPLSDMMLYIGKYPISLPARYADKEACFEYVYILSGIPLEKLYHNEQVKNPKLWEKFCSSLNMMITVDEDGEIKEEQLNG